MADENITTEEGERNLKLQESRKNEGLATQKAAAVAGPMVSKSEFGMMIGFASFCDLISQVPLVGFIIDGIAWFTIFAWTQARELKKPWAFHLSGASGFIPFLPAYTGMVVFLYFYNKSPQFRTFFGE
ncbi:MAG: hypothetical protein HYY55_03050 [Candidatus Niyogibacteria bacterium]|nr:MAG: hypothetical protein HYY55_03050 [Candidatus Niyogibacteria bacterium]